MMAILLALVSGGLFGALLSGPKNGARQCPPRRSRGCASDIAVGLLDE